MKENPKSNSLPIWKKPPQSHFLLFIFRLLVFTCLLFLFADKFDTGYSNYELITALILGAAAGYLCGLTRYRIWIAIISQIVLIGIIAGLLKTILLILESSLTPEEYLELHFAFKTYLHIPLFIYLIVFLSFLFFQRLRFYLIIEWILVLCLVIWGIWGGLFTTDGEQQKFLEQFREFPTNSWKLFFISGILIIKVLAETIIPRFKKDTILDEISLPQNKYYLSWIMPLIFLIIIIGGIFILIHYMKDKYEPPSMGLFGQTDQPAGGSSEEGANDGSDEGDESGGQQGIMQLDYQRYLELLPEVNQSNQLIMLANMSMPELLRTEVFSAFNPQAGFGKEWNPWENDLPVFSQSLRWQLNEIPELTSRKEFLQRFYIQNFDRNVFIGANFPIRSFPIQNINTQKYSRTYSTVSMVYSGIKGLLQLVKNYDNVDPEFMEYYTDYGDVPEIKQLADSILAPEIDDEQDNDAESMDSSADEKPVNLLPIEKVMLIQDYLETNYTYTLNPGGEDVANRLLYFLLENKKGYCTYFAFSMAVLCRAASIPARVAVGFMPRQQRSQMGFYIILGSDIHAWVEVYFPEYGWINFDPQAEQYDMPVSEEQNREDFSQYLEDIMEILQNEPAEEDPLHEDMDREEDRTPSRWRTKSGLLIILLIIVSIYIVSTSGVQLFRKILPDFITNRQRKIFYMYAYLLLMLNRAGLKRMRGETAIDFSKRLITESNSSVDIQAITNLYLQARFNDEVLPEFSYREITILNQKAVRGIYKNMSRRKKVLKAVRIFIMWFNPVISWKSQLKIDRKY